MSEPDGFVAGYGTDTDGRSACFACCNAGEAERMRTAERFTAYVSSDGEGLTTWPGGKLARVVGAASHRGGFHRSRIFTWTFETPDGARWYGRNGGAGMCITIRRAKARRAA